MPRLYAAAPSPHPLQLTEQRESRGAGAGLQPVVCDGTQKTAAAV